MRQIELVSDSFRISFDYSEELLAGVKESFPLRRWDSLNKCWWVPGKLGKEVLEFSQRFDFQLSKEAGDASLRSGSVECGSDNNTRAHSVSDSVSIEGLRSFQREAVAFALQAKRVLIADEMGLGKSLTAIATVESAAAYPCLVICPASIKINWQREIHKWLPTLATSTILGSGDATGSKWAIVNYDQLKKHGEYLRSVAWQSVILDEAHYVKNYKAARTIRVQQLVQGREYVLALTGTPVLNRPIEMIQLLRVIRQVGVLGGFWPAAMRYTNGFSNEYGWDLSGAAHLEELHSKVNGRVYIRRLKSEVARDLPAKSRVVVPLEIDNRREYDLATMETRRWARSYYGGGAEALVQIEKLKQLAVAGKMRSAIEWIIDVLETGEKLVVFAHHVKVQEDLLAAINGAGWGGVGLQGAMSMEERQASVDSFQNDDAVRCIVCSLQAGGVGITLTAASNVCFVELGWSPAQHDQAEDRLHRIGQTNPVTAYYLLGVDTIDEWISEMLDEKRVIVDAATDGKKTEESHMLTALMERMRAR